MVNPPNALALAGGVGGTSVFLAFLGRLLLYLAHRDLELLVNKWESVRPEVWQGAACGAARPARAPGADSQAPPLKQRLPLVMLSAIFATDDACVGALFRHVSSTVGARMCQSSLN